MDRINALLAGKKLNIKVRDTNGSGVHGYVVDNLDNGKECVFEHDDVASFIDALIMIEAI